MCSTPKGGLSLRPPAPVKPGLSEQDDHFHTAFRASNNNVERLRQQRQQAFKAQEPEFHQQIEIDQIRCPAHVLQMTRMLKQLPHHHTLKIISLSASLIADLAASARVLQYRTRILRFRSQHFLYVIPASRETQC